MIVAGARRLPAHWQAFALTSSLLIAVSIVMTYLSPRLFPVLTTDPEVDYYIN